MGGEKKEREGVGESSEKWTFEMRASFIFFFLPAVFCDRDDHREMPGPCLTVSSWAPGAHQKDESNNTHNDSY